MVNSETTIKYLEEDIAQLETEIAELNIERQTKEEQKPVDMEKMKAAPCISDNQDKNSFNNRDVVAKKKGKEGSSHANKHENCRTQKTKPCVSVIIPGRAPSTILEPF